MYSDAIETALIGGLFNHPDFFEEVAADLKPEFFYGQDYRAIFEAMLKIDQRRMKIDRLSVNHILNNEDLEELVESLDHTYSHIDQAVHHAKIIHDSYGKRVLLNGFKKGQEMLNNSQDQDLEETLEKANEIMTKSLSVGDKGKSSSSYKDIMPRYMAKLSDRIESDEPVAGLSTGYPDLDNQISGMSPAQLILVAARPAMGKTTFAINLCENATLMSGKWALTFSLEMGEEELFERSVSRFATVNIGHLRNGKLTESDISRIENATPKLENTKIKVDDIANATPSTIRAKALRTKRELEAQGEELGMIMVDYIQLMSIPGYKGSERTAEISEISRCLKLMAKELGIPIVALSQLNRSLEQRPNKRPLPSDLRESGSLEQDADVIMFIYRDEVYNEDTTDKGMAEIIIGKQRSGPTGTICLNFKGQYSAFEHREQDEIPHLREHAIEQEDIEAEKGPVAVDNDPPF